MSYGDDYEDTSARRIPARTRTRLPEQEESASRRPPSSPRRNVATILGVVVVLLAAIAFANRSTDGDGGSGGSTGDSAPDGGAQATAPTGEQPVDDAFNGIPTGHAQTEQGAQSAAANYAVALGGVEMFNAQQRQTIVDTVYAPDAAGDRVDEYNAAYSDPDFLSRIGLTEAGAAPDGLTFVSRTIPVGTSITGFSGDTASVSVWYSSLFGLAGADSRNPVTESWYTNTYDLVWVEDDWRITDFTQEDGPVPVGRDQRASTAEEMADAIEQFGGFTYAR
ncbi:hypothetical protein [Streptomyces sp. MP131-18]|uniref:hypothetical protein n=1 Tax=Streptomyces sp. MP131-18 TaxID=1857892 RepID=UPI00097BDC01|nr:hypothetical protein [Streptomyces sp. MP131-18]ONK12270.1 hypothetical protein STBA_30100 [Streptomyces sp. MP131-18]